MGRRFMKPSDTEMAATMTARSYAPLEAASDVITAMPTTDDDWSSTSMVCWGWMSWATAAPAWAT